MNRKSLGDKGEKTSAKYLTNKGYNIIARNYRTRYGEIDIIAKYKGILVFVEVKLRTNTKYGRGIEAITSHKIQKIHQVAVNYIQEHYDIEPECRFDVIEILNSNEMEILHLENAF